VVGGHFDEGFFLEAAQKGLANTVEVVAQLKGVVKAQAGVGRLEVVGLELVREGRRLAEEVPWQEVLGV
jgi:hypothetical protein